MLFTTFPPLVPKRLVEGIITLDHSQWLVRGEEHLEFDLGYLSRNKPSECIYDTWSKGKRKKKPMNGANRGKHCDKESHHVVC
jgi:hypothetical protein